MYQTERGEELNIKYADNQEHHRKESEGRQLTTRGCPGACHSHTTVYFKTVFPPNSELLLQFWKNILQEAKYFQWKCVTIITLIYYNTKPRVEQMPWWAFSIQEYPPEWD